ncbi:SH3 domain-containing protein [Sphingomonas sp. JC676]|nr:SH3 domain-containing protein [Sphingomonas sp. JC676]
MDPRVDAVRRDLADVRLADRVFAPHYAAPMPRTLSAAISLRAASAADSEILAQLPQGDVFEVLELAGGNAWGVARGPGLVGYIDAGALGDPA